MDVLPRPERLVGRTLQRASALCLLAAIVGCGKSSGNAGPPGGGNPIVPSPAVVSVAVTHPGGELLFIGRTVQLQARETLSDGTTRVATSISWSTDAPAVATVSGSGIVTGVGAGEATISAGSAPRGSFSIRVYPSFSGTWTGEEVVESCEDSLDFRGICDEFFPIGDVYLHESELSQDAASVTAVIDAGDGVIARTSGTIRLDGELELAPVFFDGTDGPIELRAWRSRSDQPGRMTGSYEIVASDPKLQGSFIVTLRLQNVRRLATVSGGPPVTAARTSSLAERVAAALKTR